MSLSRRLDERSLQPSPKYPGADQRDLEMLHPFSAAGVWWIINVCVQMLENNPQMFRALDGETWKLWCVIEDWILYFKLNQHELISTQIAQKIRTQTSSVHLLSSSFGLYKVRWQLRKYLTKSFKNRTSLSSDDITLATCVNRSQWDLNHPENPGNYWRTTKDHRTNRLPSTMSPAALAQFNCWETFIVDVPNDQKCYLNKAVDNNWTLGPGDQLVTD